MEQAAEEMVGRDICAPGRVLQQHDQLEDGAAGHALGGGKECGGIRERVGAVAEVVAVVGVEGEIGQTGEE